jgi:hypothetical protein
MVIASLTASYQAINRNSPKEVSRLSGGDILALGESVQTRVRRLLSHCADIILSLLPSSPHLLPYPQEVALACASKSLPA